VTVNGQVILLAKTPQGIKATSPKCPHYGAPLVKGVLSGDRIVCPWHGACFSANTGDIEDAPSVDCIEVFPVRVQGDDVFVTVPDTIPAKRTPAFKTSAAKAGGKTVVVVGGGAAGNSAVETLRKEGFDGRIVMISQEQYVPYDRPKLSKNMAVGAEAIALRPKQFYQDIGVELMLGEKVVELDAATKKVRLEKGLVLDYDECIVCTGSRSFNIPVPGHDLGNVFTLRDPDDAKKIDSVITPDSNVVLIGTGFIGLEAATYLKNTKKVKNVTAVSLDKVPLERVLGARLGELLQKVHESNGVKMLLGVHLQSYQGKDGKVTGVVINEQKEAIPADGKNCFEVLHSDFL
jgi:nitrite reductase/ring-hydroxylating ferredoxin subunit/thioredoxin reductase